MHDQGRLVFFTFKFTPASLGQIEDDLNESYLSFTKDEIEKRMKILAEKWFEVRFKMSVHTSTQL